MRYGQFCPVAKATELLGERWTFLIVRELLMGGRRFSELQRGLGEISPALLTARLKMFEEQGLVVRRQIPGQRGFEYFPTQACEALLPVIVALGEWGLLWARQTLSADDFDPEFLMFYLERSVDPAALPGGKQSSSSVSLTSRTNANGGLSSRAKRPSSAWSTRAATSTCGSTPQFEPCMMFGWAIAHTARRSTAATW
ncbi:helix-turn-helix transcriptional regulator [Sphingomonas sp. HDW15A]|uniref:winged helix-turn-helix transcriptional regulator n=1 Tax=Sphingomonas sp. HDW15A TaxID=2714942 RepID=UPI001407D180|nr:helix-turn-helix domain-containing protein [Sphingomonas sp. HDW15A]QIK95493.1 helix-turn-helix transcriptional regulator [Sphingomonas sp. HDW15A]